MYRINEVLIPVYSWDKIYVMKFYQFVEIIWHFYYPKF